jgi:hypothetical protein
MIGSSRNDSSTIRATPSANGEVRSSRNFSKSSSARSDVGSLAESADVLMGVVAVAEDAMAPSDAAGVASKISNGTPSAREIRLRVPA